MTTTRTALQLLVVLGALAPAASCGNDDDPSDIGVDGDVAVDGEDVPADVVVDGEDVPAEVPSDVPADTATDVPPVNACESVVPGDGSEGSPCSVTSDCDGRQYCNRTRCACYPPGECVDATDCSDEGHDWRHDGCVGAAECNAGLCEWVCS